MVTTQINENLGQGGRADLVCHWEDSDTVVQEVYANVRMTCISFPCILVFTGCGLFSFLFLGLINMRLHRVRCSNCITEIQREKTCTAFTQTYLTTLS